MDALPDAASAHLAVLRLAQEDIAARLCDENVLHWDPLLDVAIGGIRVVVPFEDAERARAVLAEWRCERARLRCPECSSTEIVQDRRRPRIVFGVLAVLLLRLPLGRGLSRCSACGYAWRR